MYTSLFFICVSGYLIWMDPFNETSYMGLHFLGELIGYTPVLKMTFSNVKSIVQNDLFKITSNGPYFVLCKDM